MKKKILSVVLILALALTVAAPALAAYSDLPKSYWATEYMEDLAARGYLTGYSDGTMKPENKMTACETLAMLSRFYKPSDAARKMIGLDYQNVVMSSVPASLYWAYDEMTVCLAAGIITENELKTINLSAEISKVQLAVFLVRAMQLETAAKALANMSLPFADADKIPADSKGHVAELKTLGIVSGDDKNNFAPDLKVTRAVVAAMISRSLDYLELQKKTLTLTDYEGITRIEGVVANATGSTFELRCYDGLTRTYAVPATAVITVNGEVKPLTAAYAGCHAMLSLKSGAIAKIEIDKDSDVRWVQGNISGIYNSTWGITIRDAKDGALLTYNIRNDTKITKDGVTVSFVQLELRYFVSLKIQNGVVTEVIANSNDLDLTGTITSLDFGLTVTMKIADESGVAYSFQMDIGNMPKILRGTKTVTIDRLNVGDNVTITMDNGYVTTITATSNANTITGELASIVSTTNGTSWVIKNSDGTTTTYTLDSSAAAYSGTTAILISNIKAGDKVSVVVYGTTITEVYLLSALNSTTKLTATVMAVDYTHATITVLTASNNLLYIDTRNVSSVIKASTGGAISITSIQVNASIVAYGAYADSTTFKATSIVVES